VSLKIWWASNGLQPIVKCYTGTSWIFVMKDSGLQENTSASVPFSCWKNFSRTMINFSIGMNGSSTLFTSSAIRETYANYTKGIIKSSSCHSGYCYYFDGVTSGIDLRQPFTLNDYTLSAWVYPSAYQDPGVIMGRLFSASNSGYGLRQINNNGQLQFFVTQGNAITTGSGVLPLASWSHIVGTYNHSKAALYVNGYQVGELSLTTATDNLAGYNLTIGKRHSIGQFWQGFIDDVSVYNKSLTPVQVKNLFNGSLFTKKIALGSYYAVVNYSNSSTVGSASTALTNVSFGSANFTFFYENTGAAFMNNVTLEASQNVSYYRYGSSSGQKIVRNLFGSGLWTFAVSSPGYAKRFYYLTVDNFGILNQKAYLLGNTSLLVTFNMKNGATGNAEDQVLISQYRRFGSSWDLLEAKPSDITGKAAFYYEPSTEYRFILSKDNFETVTFSLNPVLYSDYDVKIYPLASGNQSLDLDRVTVAFGNAKFTDGVSQNFTTVITSAFGELSSYSYTLSYPGGSASGSGTAPSGQTFVAPISISGAAPGDSVKLGIVYSTTRSEPRQLNFTYGVAPQKINNSMESLSDNTYGLGYFERVLITVLLGLIALGLGSLIGKPVIGMGMMFFVFGYAAYIQFVPLWSVLISFFVAIILISNQVEY
jgi:hypothetical protein